MRSPVRIWIAAPAQDTSKPEGFGVFLFCGRGCKASPLGRGVCEADGEGKPGRIELRYSDKQALCQSGAIVVYVILRQRPCPLRRFAPRPGCGTQRLLRCRLHPAGRCPNSSSLFPPLAAVVAVAPKGGAAGVCKNNKNRAAGSNITCGAVYRLEEIVLVENGFLNPVGTIKIVYFIWRKKSTRVVKSGEPALLHKTKHPEVFGLQGVSDWSCYPDSNWRPHPYQGCALPTEL